MQSLPLLIIYTTKLSICNIVLEGIRLIAKDFYKGIKCFTHSGAEDPLWRAMALAIPCLARTPLQIAGPRFQAGVRPPWIGRRGPGDRFKAAENDSMKKRGSRIVGRGLSDCLSYFGFYSCSPCKLVGLLGGWGRKPACECAASRQVRREKR